MSVTDAVRESERRPLRVFAFDPMVDRFATPITLRVPYEHVAPGPVGRLVAVHHDRPGGGPGAALDLDDPAVLIGGGLAPSETDRRSHQQVVYAVSMVVLEAFERGLGRPILWHAGRPLRVLPHGDDLANAYFDLERFEVVFGTFEAVTRGQGRNIAGQTVYSCLSWDVVAHEVSHPVLVDLRPFEVGRDAVEDPSVETLAIHEGLCDLVALLVRMSDPSAVRPVIERNGVDLAGTPLLQLAVQFGQASGLEGALRHFPSPVEGASEPHGLGMALTSAFVEAFLATLRQRTLDLFGLHGPPRSDGWLHPDLVGRLVRATTNLAQEVLDTCTGALDLLPPFGARFVDVLRAAITVSIERHGPAADGFRARLIEACFDREMVPAGTRSLAVESLALTAGNPIRDPLPHAADALLLTQDALDLRRAWMSADPAPRELAASEVKAGIRRLRRWHTEIARWCRRHAAPLGLDPDRPVRMANLTGSYRVDPTKTVRSRITVQAVQPAGGRGGRGRPRGATVVADSTGHVSLVQRVPTGRRPAREV
jgi:hypothetical protein